MQQRAVIYYDNESVRKTGFIQLRRKCSGRGMIEKEIEQVKAAKLSCYKYGFISKSGFACTRRADTILIELGELFLENANLHVFSLKKM